MNTFLFYLLLPIIFYFSILPRFILKGISFILSKLLYHVLGYRKEVVIKNLKRSFPEKSSKEIMAIAKRFYLFFTDMIFDSLKLFTISRERLIDRCEIINTEIFDKLHQEKRSAILVLGHYGSWEMCGVSLTNQIKQQLYAIYKPLSSESANNLAKKMRGRLGTKLIAARETYRVIEEKEKNKETAVYAFIADQAAKPERSHWMEFLNQDTAVFLGTEKVAKKHNLAIVYCFIRETKRGQYTLTLEMLEENPRDTKDGEITEKHTKRLEQSIKEVPYLWLWSHKRWKHTRPKKQSA